MARVTAPASSVLARASIVAVGSELLQTTRLDTNSLFITEQLNGVGIEVASKHVAGDDRGAPNAARWRTCSADRSPRTPEWSST
jgi:hypothetical protein